MATGFGLAMASPASAAGTSVSHDRWNDCDYGNSYHYNHYRWNRFHQHRWFNDRFYGRHNDRWDW